MELSQVALLGVIGYRVGGGEEAASQLSMKNCRGRQQLEVARLSLIARPRGQSLPSRLLTTLQQSPREAGEEPFLY